MLFEQLESRQMFDGSAGMTPSDPGSGSAGGAPPVIAGTPYGPEPTFRERHIDISGTPFDDTISIWFGEDLTCTVMVNGLCRTYPWSPGPDASGYIDVQTGGGNDTVWYQMGYSTYCDFQGGAGNDTFYVYGTDWARRALFIGGAGFDTWSFQYNESPIKFNLGGDTFSD